MSDKKKRIMRSFKMNEISAVNRPAQEGATVTIMKRAGEPGYDPKNPDKKKRGSADEDIEKGGDLVSLFSGLSDQHQHGISVRLEEHRETVVVPDGLDDFLRETPFRVVQKPTFIVRFASAGGPDDVAHDHQITVAEDGTYLMSANHGHSHTLTDSEVVAAIANAIAKADCEGLEPAGPDATITPPAGAGQEENEPMTEDAKKVAERTEALEAENKTLKAVAALSPTHKAHYDALDPALDDDTRKAFLELSADERESVVTKAVAKAAESTDVVYEATDGTVYTKSDDPRLANMAKDRDEDRKETIRLRKAAETAEFTKRAETDLANFPGDVSVRAAIVKAVDGIADETIRSAANDALKAQNAKLATAFETIGAGGTPVVAKSADKQGAEDELDQLAKAHASKEGVDYFTAYEVVSEANPELLTKAVG